MTRRRGDAPASWSRPHTGAPVVDARWKRAAGVVLVTASFACCAKAAVPPSPPQTGRGTPPFVRIVDDRTDASALLDAGTLPLALTTDATVPFDDPMSLHLDTPEALRALMGEAGSLAMPVGGGAWRFSQGNRAIARHSIGPRACQEGLKDVVFQTAEQRARCGADNMVPVWERGGSIATARFCIDVFEFPGKPCELPFVFITPAQALRVCHAQGKRLCTQDEWNLSCRADPEGGPDQTYAYGNDLDLTICDTNKARPPSQRCDISSSERLWNTCGTDTEPAGAFPKCRSRFGVYDQHGNVAEIMTRFEPADGKMYTQLKGSAFFYVEVAKKPTDPGGYWTRYPDQCNFDPRWHVEKLEESGHMNYHLGFRCCKALSPADAGGE